MDKTENHVHLDSGFEAVLNVYIILKRREAIQIADFRDELAELDFVDWCEWGGQETPEPAEVDNPNGLDKKDARGMPLRTAMLVRKVKYALLGEEAPPCQAWLIGADGNWVTTP